jgi:hypothetical protein
MLMVTGVKDEKSTNDWNRLARSISMMSFSLDVNGRAIEEG